MEAPQAPWHSLLPPPGPPCSPAQVAELSSEHPGVCRIGFCAAKRGIGCEASGRPEPHQFLLHIHKSLPWVAAKKARERDLLLHLGHLMPVQVPMCDVAALGIRSVQGYKGNDVFWKQQTLISLP